MCSLAGFLSNINLGTFAELTEIANSMGQSIEHRGPDHGGVWVDEQAGVALSHRRLSIIDLSPAGAQPMSEGWRPGCGSERGLGHCGGLSD
jgi:asparagine synthase (glutamine-hydrolysing)